MLIPLLPVQANLALSTVYSVIERKYSWVYSQETFVNLSCIDNFNILLRTFTVFESNHQCKLFNIFAMIQSWIVCIFEPDTWSTSFPILRIEIIFKSVEQIEGVLPIFALLVENAELRFVIGYSLYLHLWVIVLLPWQINKSLKFEEHRKRSTYDKQANSMVIRAVGLRFANILAPTWYLTVH